MQIKTRRLLAPVSIDDISPTDFKQIAFIPLFDRAAMFADAEAEFR